MIPCNSYYGSYRTRTFNEIFEGSVDVFKSSLNEISGENIQTILGDKVNLTFVLLSAKYGNSHIANSDENQFKLQLFSKIFQYAPTWVKRLDIQSDLRKLTKDELMQGAKAIYNQAFNPDTAPSTGALEELTRIAGQNTTNYKKSAMEAYAMLSELLETDVSELFLNKFKPLFIKVAAPDYPLLYETEAQYGTDL